MLYTLKILYNKSLAQMENKLLILEVKIELQLKNKEFFSRRSTAWARLSLWYLTQ